MKPPKSQKNREKEIKEAKKAKEFLENIVLNKVITIECGDWDKYGRLLGTLYKNNFCSKTNINKLLISEGLAKGVLWWYKNNNLKLFLNIFNNIFFTLFYFITF